MKHCKLCGETDQEQFYTSTVELKCKPCMIRLSKQRQRRGKERSDAEKLKAGKCVKCNRDVTNETTHYFEWNHLEPKDKLHCISHIAMRTDEIFYTELSKCELLCLFCHADVTKEQGSLYGVRKRKER
jgi:hypothetical protein